MDTSELIQSLVEACAPVGPLPRPWIRTLEWLLVALSYVALVVLVVSPRADLSVTISDWHFIFEQIVAVATGITAAAAAFATIIPAYRRKIVALPMLWLIIWLVRLAQDYGQRGLGNRMRLPPNGSMMHAYWYCLPAIVLAGSVPAIAITMMLRRGAPLAPHLTAGLGGLAAAALGSFAVRLFCPMDANLIVPIWQFGIVCTISILAGCAGKFVLNSPASALAS